MPKTVQLVETKAAQHFGKQRQHFWKSPDTLDYMDAVSKTLKSNELVQAKAGRYGGTWAHPKLAIFFARWLDVRFAVWCDAMIEDILKGNAECQWLGVLRPANFCSKFPSAYHGDCRVDLPPVPPLAAQEIT